MHLRTTNSIFILDQKLILTILLVVAIGTLLLLLIWKFRRKATIPYFDTEAMEVAKATAELKNKYNYKELMPEHFLWALFDRPGKSLNEFLSQHRLDPLEGKKVLEELFVRENLDNKETMPSQLYVGKYVKQVINKAGINVERRKASKITPSDLFESLLETIVSSDESVYDEIKSFMNSRGVSIERILEQLKKASGIN